MKVDDKDDDENLQDLAENVLQEKIFYTNQNKLTSNDEKKKEIYFGNRKLQFVLSIYSKINCLDVTDKYSYSSRIVVKQLLCQYQLYVMRIKM